MNSKSMFSEILNAMGQLVVASILWSFCCLPILTIGPASMALYYTVVKVIRRERSTVFEAFFHAFKVSFWQSVNWNILLLGYYGLVSLAALLRIRATGGFVLDTVMGVIFAFAILGAWMIPFVYPVISRFFHKGFALFRFMLYIAIRHFPVTLVCIGLLLATALLCLYNSALLIFLPGLYALIQSFLLEPIFKSLSTDDGSDNYLEWYADMDPDHWTSRLTGIFRKKSKE